MDLKKIILKWKKEKEKNKKNFIENKINYFQYLQKQNKIDLIYFKNLHFILNSK